MNSSVPLNLKYVVYQQSYSSLKCGKTNLFTELSRFVCCRLFKQYIHQVDRDIVSQRHTYFHKHYLVV